MKKKILLIIPNLDFGGAQNSLARLSRLLERKYIVKLIVFNKDNIAKVDLGGELLDLKVPGSRHWLGKVVYFFMRVIRIKAIKREFKPDISISFLEGADYVNILSRTSEKVFFYIHGSKLYDRNIRGFLGFLRKRILIPLLYSLPDRILVVNQQIEQELKISFNLDKQRYDFMPNFYDFDEITKLATVSLDDPMETFFKENKVISISGRLAPEKGIDKFVKVLPPILRVHPDVRLILIGDGPHKESIIKELVQLNISFEDSSNLTNKNAFVHFLGYQKNPYTFIARSIMLALPSLNEGMPNTIIEAQSLGVPIIASDCHYGPRELLASQSPSGAWPELATFGILAPVISNSDDLKHWITAIEILLTNSTLRNTYRVEGVKKVQEFSFNAVTEKWHHLLES